MSAVSVNQEMLLVRVKALEGHVIRLQNALESSMNRLHEHQQRIAHLLEETFSEQVLTAATEEQKTDGDD